MDGMKSRIESLSAEARTSLVRRLVERTGSGRIAGRARGSTAAPLSSAQERLWFVQQLNPDAPIYNSPIAFRFRGELDTQSLRAAFLEIVRRHDVLRTTIVQKGDLLVQRVHDTLPDAFRVVDVRDAPDPEGRARKLASADAAAANPRDHRSRVFLS